MEAATIAAAASTDSNASDYRLKFNREEFLQLVEIAQPRIIYRRDKKHLFAFDGFVMYTQKCSDEDFKVKLINAIESATTIGKPSPNFCPITPRPSPLRCEHQPLENLYNYRRDVGRVHQAA